MHHWVAQQLKADKRELKGKVIFQDARGKVCRLPFFVDTSFYEWALADETELLKVQHAMTKVPDLLEKMSVSLGQINKTLQP